jgi:predicted dehydrogenase
MKLKVGVVGGGRIATESHLPVLKSLANVEVTAICDQQSDAVRSAASKYGVKAIYTDLEGMLSKENLDVLDICTPPFTHSSLSIQAMEAGCHVLTEKPMATSVQDADKMIGSMKKNNVTLCVVHQNLRNPAFLKLHRMVKSGSFGDLLSVDAKTFERKDGEMVTNPKHWGHKLPGGVFFEILPHPVYLLQAFLDNIKIASVVGKKLSTAEWMANDEIRVVAEADNALGSIHASCNSLIAGDSLDVMGSKMSAHVELGGRTLITSKPLGKSSAMSIGMSNLALSLQLFKVLGTTASTVLHALGGSVRVSAHYTFISDFINSVCNKSRPPVTAEEGRENVRILEEISKQLEGNRAVSGCS